MSPSIQVSLGVSLEIVLRCLHAMSWTQVVHLICSRGNWHCCLANSTFFSPSTDIVTESATIGLFYILFFKSLSYTLLLCVLFSSQAKTEGMLTNWKKKKTASTQLLIFDTALFASCFHWCIRHCRYTSGAQIRHKWHLSCQRLLKKPVVLEMTTLNIQPIAHSQLLIIIVYCV